MFSQFERVYFSPNFELNLVLKCDDMEISDFASPLAASALKMLPPESSAVLNYFYRYIVQQIGSGFKLVSMVKLYGYFSKIHLITRHLGDN